jgi:membrane protein
MFDRIGRRSWRVVRSAWRGWLKDDGFTLSAAIAYCGAFSLFPLCLVLIAGMGVAGRYSTCLQSEQHALVAHVEKNVSPWLAGELESILSGVQSQAVLGGPLGLAALILAAISIFVQLENVFTRIWQSPAPPRKGWLAAIREALWNRLSAFLTLLVIGVMLVVVFVADVILVGMRSYLSDLPVGYLAWKAAQTVVTVGCDAALLTTIYYVLPKVRVPWRAAIGGGVLAAVIWSIGRGLLLLLVVGKQYSAYGIVGALMGVMFWYYYASVVVLLGAEFVRALAEEEQPRVQMIAR